MKKLSRNEMKVVNGGLLLLLMNAVCTQIQKQEVFTDVVVLLNKQRKILWMMVVPILI
ncbi:bacteriocin-like protein [Pedobacter riviphilus]|uniref:bacteriocin-like protein n=1 Tax=Pedobacter riviphilus TaxID=2766984 RepID=UPI0038B272FB